MAKGFDFYSEFEKMVKDTGVSSVVVLGHMNPDGDSVGTVFGLAHFLQTAYPELSIYPYMPTVTEKGAKLLLSEETFFEINRLPEDPYIVVCCDTAIKERVITGDVFDLAKGSIGLDHHRSNESFCDVNHVELTESCAELVFMLLMERPDAGRIFVKDRASVMAGAPKDGTIPPCGADYFYMGILHDTAVFTRANVYALKAAELLLGLGVDHRNIMRTWETQTFKELIRQNLLVGSATTVADGKIAYVIRNYEEAQAEGISYDDIHHISNLLRNCADVVAAFTMYEQEPGYWRCSLRSDGKIVDANEVFGRYGGGGHKGAAGLRIKVGDAMKIKEELIVTLTELVNKES